MVDYFEDAKPVVKKKTNIFDYTKKVAVVIGISDYSKLRDMPGKEAFADVPQAYQDVKVVEAGLARLGFMPEEIRVLMNPCQGDLMMAINMVLNDVYMNSKNGDRTLVYIYYAGHGACDNNTYVICGEGKMFALEKSIRVLGRMENSFVIGLFDCCREKIAEGEWRGSGGATENEGMIDVLDQNSARETDPQVPQINMNVIVTYGCPPSSGVPLKSTIAILYFKELKRSADADGRIVLPGPLNFFIGDDGKCETVSKVTKQLVLVWEDMVAKVAAMNAAVAAGLTMVVKERKLSKIKKDKMFRSHQVRNSTAEMFGEPQSPDDLPEFIEERDEADEESNPNDSAAFKDGDQPLSTSNSDLLEEDAVFACIGEECEEYYNFAKDLQDVEYEIGFKELRSLQNICLLPNMDLLIEGPLMDFTVEVYAISRDQGDLTTPKHTIKTNATRLSAIAYNEDVIYMGFIGSLVSPDLNIQVYNYDYELVHQVDYPMKNNGFTDLMLMMDGQFLIGAHNEGKISVYNADECTVEVFEDVFGYVDTIWSIETIGNLDNESSCEYFCCATTNGIYVCAVYETGQVIYSQRVFYEGCNVTNVEKLQSMTVFATMHTSGGCDKMFTLDVVTEDEEVIFENMESSYDIIDMGKLPGTDPEFPYFILHSQEGLLIVDIKNKRLYNLSNQAQDIPAVCRSMCIMSIDAEDATKGFWLSQIDSSNASDIKIRCYDFQQDFMDNLNKQAQKMSQARKTGSGWNKN